MKKEIINMMYVDDLIDRGISKCLDKYQSEKVEIKYIEIEFNAEYNYKKLIEEVQNNNINILVIDSALYLESSEAERFTGEQFKVILKKFLPYVETIVISQNKQENTYDIMKKYNKDEVNSKETISEYYTRVLYNIINKKIDEILMGREVLTRLKEEKTIDNILLEKISLSLNGEEKYSELKSEDVQNLINSFKELKRLVDGQK